MHHVATLPLGTLARDMYEVMVRNKLPGLVTECAPILEELGLTDIQSFTKYTWKRTVKRNYPAVEG